MGMLEEILGGIRYLAKYVVVWLWAKLQMSISFNTQDNDLNHLEFRRENAHALACLG